jgi:hypothetical protein
MRIQRLRHLILVGITVLWLSILTIPAGAQVNIQVGIPLPPPLIFSAPPQLVVLPETYVYVVPDIAEDVFFVDGWWWRPWQGHWYRSQYYDRGWGYYPSVPSFYREVPQDWRHEYRDHQWRGQPWNYERVPHEQAEHNWNTWKHDKYWENHQTWGVQGLNLQPHARDQQPQAPQWEHHGQQAQASQWEHHGQQPQAWRQQSQQPNDRQGYRERGNQGQRNERPVQRQASQQHGAKHDQ